MVVIPKLANMFRGVSTLNLDSKGRLAMPAKYRDQLMELCGGRLVATVDPDRCLLIYPTPEWEQIQTKLMQLPSFDKKARSLQRLVVGHATDCELDGQGRFLVPSPLRKFSGLKKEAVLIGQGNRFELWEDKAWNEQCDAWQQAEESVDELSEALSSVTL